MGNDKKITIGGLANDTAHDINNVLQIIQTNIELLGLRHNLVEESDELIARINNAINRGEGITSELIKISKVYSDDVEGINSQKPTCSVPSQQNLLVRKVKRVLIVEDDDDVRRSTVLLMDSLEIEIEEATSADDALTLLKIDQGFDIIFSDVFMPGSLSGFGLADECSKLFPDIKVLLASGYPEEELEKLGKSMGDYNLLNKPFSIAEIESAFEKLSNS